MTICSASTLDDLRSKVCEITDLLTLAIKTAACPEREWTAIRLACQMAGAVVGAVDELIPASVTEDDPWADLKEALSNPAIRTGLASLRVDFTTGSIVQHWLDGGATIVSFMAPEGEPEVTPESDLPAGPLEAVELLTGETGEA